VLLGDRCDWWPLSRLLESGHDYVSANSAGQLGARFAIVDHLYITNSLGFHVVQNRVFIIIYRSTRTTISKDYKK
jgi:hypothetical protein